MFTKTKAKPKVAKKRPRRIVMDSSDEEEENSGVELDSQSSITALLSDTKTEEPAQLDSQKSNSSDDVIPGTPPRLVVRQQQATETFMDEDGFMVTKKVSKKVTEEARPEKSPPTKRIMVSEKSAKPSPGKKKQATLMNFFKKT